MPPATPRRNAPPTPDGVAAARRELTGRALAAGLAVGLLLAVANLYMGLKTGWWDTGHVTATVLGYALASALARRSPLGPLETNTIQTVATAVGAAPATLGLLGAIPALALLGREPPAWAVAALGLSLAALGVLGALALRRRLLEEEALPFPTGVATAEVVRALHARAGGGVPARVLAAAGAAAAAFSALRDLAGRLPAVLALPGRVGGVPASAYGLGLGLNPMLLGAGLLVGPRNGLSVLLGGAVAWALVAPALVARRVVAAPEYGPLVAWLAWPGVALVLGAGLVSLAAQRRTFAGALADVARLRGGLGAAPVRRGVALAALAALFAAAVLAGPLGVPPGTAALALVLAALLALVCVRAAGQTDILPAGEVAHVAQVGLGGGAGAAANVAAGSLTAGVSAQAGVALWSLRAGQLLGASPSLQARAMVPGALLGAAVALPLYAVLARAHGLGSAELPVPGAAPWRAVADLVAHGSAAVPPGAVPAAAVAFAAGALLEGLGRRFRALPTPGAVGMGFIAPAPYGATICLGALAGFAWRRLHPASAERLAPSAGAGAIAGESVTAAVAAVARVAGLAG